jgi:hypothetical protein
MPSSNGPKDGDKKPPKVGRVRHDASGRAIWEWAADTGKHAIDSTSRLLKRLDLPPDVALMASIVPAIVVLLPVAFFTGGALPAPTPFVVGAVLYIAIFASLIAFSLWAHGVAVIGPERAGQYVHLMPIFGAVLSTLLLGEAVVTAQLVGGAFVFAGLWLTRVGPRPVASAAGHGAKPQARATPLALRP